MCGLEMCVTADKIYVFYKSVMSTSTKTPDLPFGRSGVFIDTGLETKHRLSPPKAARSGRNSPVDCFVVEKKILSPLFT